jgi:hypothetical protein
MEKLCLKSVCLRAKIIRNCGAKCSRRQAHVEHTELRTFAYRYVLFAAFASLKIPGDEGLPLWQHHRAAQERPLDIIGAFLTQHCTHVFSMPRYWLCCLAGTMLSGLGVRHHVSRSQTSCG